MRIDYISRQLAKYLAVETGKNENILSYGLEIIIGALIKIILISIISYLLGIFTTTMTLLFFASAFRVFSGGAHCSSYRRCLITGITIFLFLGYISTIIKLPTFLFFVFIFITTLLIISVIVFWVPGGNENRQINEPERRLKFKLTSVFIIIISYLIIILLYYNNHQVISYAALIGLFWQAFTVSPPGYRFLNYIDTSLGKIKL